MKLVKYIPGTTDLACPEKELPAVIVGFGKIDRIEKSKDSKGKTIANKVGEIDVANLVIFRDNGTLIERRENVPHVDDKIEGKNETVHSYFEEYAEPKSKGGVSKKDFEDLKYIVEELTKKVNTPAAPAN